MRGLTLDEEPAGAKLILKQLSTLGIDLGALGQQLQTDGLAAFSSSLDKLSRTIETKQHNIVHA